MIARSARHGRSDGAALVLAVCGYAAFYLAFFLKSLLSGNYIAPSDSLDFGLPAFLSRPMLWTGGMYSGYPIAADPQSLTWYPVLALVRLAGLGWNAFMVAPYVVASAGAFLFVRRLTGSSLAGAFSGFAFGFSGVLIGHIGHFNQVHAASWMPLVFYGLQLVREGRRRAGTSVCAVAFALMWLAGHPQVAVYTVYAAAAVLLAGLAIDRPSKPEATRRTAWSMTGLAAGVGIAAIVIVPMIELGNFSRRAESKWEVYTSKPLPAWQLLTAVSPNTFGGYWIDEDIPVPYFGEGSTVEMMAYVGLLPLAFALASPFIPGPRRKDARVWMSIAVVAALLCLGAATPLAAIFFYAPGYSSFRVPSRHLFVVAWCVSVAAGVSFAQLSADEARRARLARTVAAAMVGAAAAMAMFFWVTPAARERLADARYVTWTLGWPAALGVALCCCVAAAAKLRGRLGTAFAAVLIALHLGDMLMFHYRWPGAHFEYADVPPEQLELHPRMRALREELRRTGQRVLAADGSKNQFLLPNLTRPWDVPAASGTGSLGIERYLDVLGMGGPGDVNAETLTAPQHQGLDLFAIGYVLVPQRSPAADELRRQAGRWTVVEDLRYYEHDPDTFYTLFRNGRALPRAWCTGRVAQTAETLLAVRSGAIPAGGPFDPSVVAVAEETVHGWRPGGSVASARVIADHRNGGHRYLITTASPCLLVLGEVYYPWWRASSDGVATAVIRVNHAMIGVPIEAGTHVVELSLRPVTVWLGAGITAASAAGLAGLALLRPRRGRETTGT